MCRDVGAADSLLDLAGAIQRFVTRMHAPDRTANEAHEDLIHERRLIDLLTSTSPVRPPRSRPRMPPTTAAR